MDKLHLGIEIRDFDLERMGFALLVLDQTGNRSTSEAYLRMTLNELNTFLNALKAAQGDLQVSTMESATGKSVASAGAATIAPGASVGEHPSMRRR